jgi:hypothetical protein
MKDIATIEIHSADGTAVAIGDLWVEKPLVLVFVRHFG